jgi:hypothetical protein
MLKASVMPRYMMPALLISTSTRPSFKIRANPAATDPSLATSMSITDTFFEWASSAAFLPALRPSASRIVPQTRYPLSAKALTAPSPNPLLAPVMTTVVRFSFNCVSCVRV